ncbi:MAG: putative cardiolipin synthase [Rhodocyclaceae bacterium]|nr:MAG: putative cardiolipin synthase [Rhodocyclaceae bacterium]TND04161.1 MAG: putative cardiolipin synthase [Rhodocyclaceae bacterium]
MSAALRDAAEHHFLGGNRLSLLESGAEYFPAVIAAIDAALHEVHLEAYIFADDSTGRRVATALGNAALRGVAVRVLVDGFGAREFAAGLGESLAAQGVEVMTYRPEIGKLRFRRHRLRRLHRKLVVVDGRTAFVGGINVLDDFDDGKEVSARFDYAVSIEGPLVARIHVTCRHVWRLVRWASLGRRPPPPAPLPAAPGLRGTTLAALLIRDNLRHRRDIENAYLGAIHRARNEIVIANAYFLPGLRFRKALLAAAKRGVSVTLLLQGRVEYVLQHFATQSLYDRMLSAGVRVFEYEKGFLHAKVAVIDKHWATVGSSNIDPFSFLLSREANLVVRDAAFAGELRASLDRAISGASREIRSQDHRRRSWLARLVAAAAYSLVRILVGVTRYGGKQ